MKQTTDFLPASTLTSPLVSARAPATRCREPCPHRKCPSKRFQIIKHAVQRGAPIEQLAIVLSDHLQVLVAEQFPEVFQLIWVLNDELRGEGVPQGWLRSAAPWRMPPSLKQHGSLPCNFAGRRLCRAGVPVVAESSSGGARKPASAPSPSPPCS
jgi:hypothetical protein